MTAEDLIAFESEVARRFNAGEIKAPVHLYSGNESAMLDIFQDVKPEDWVCCSWRSHYQCLLKGVPPDELMAEIVAGRSIALCFPKYRIYSSAIVGGSLPIALGLAMGIKRRGGSERVFAFLGDMTSRTGIFEEVLRYGHNWQLPIEFIIEDNGKSVCTDTIDTWNDRRVFPYYPMHYVRPPKMVRWYSYETKYPHAGAGQRVQF